MFNIESFRYLTKKVIAAEKYGFWSDWTKTQQYEYCYGDWESFSRSRGYSEKEIKQFRQWMEIVREAKKKGINALYYISDLALEAALINISKDKNGEILKSSHLPGTKEETICHG